MRFTAPLLVFCLAPALLCHAQLEPTLGGYVSLPGTTTYSVNGIPVLCNPEETQERHVGKAQTLLFKECPLRFVGESLTLWGTKRNGVLHATRVETDQPVDLAVDGYALVDRILAPVSIGSGIVRADGYPLTITPATKIIFAPDSTLNLATITANIWVRYSGTLHPDGTVTAASLLFAPNIIRDNENNLRTKTDFDASAVTEQDRQGTVNRMLLGRKASRIPASQDAATQQRVSTLGQRVVPDYQRQLSATDPTRIDFRFQLVHDTKLHTTLTEPSGVIQVPESIPANLHNDAELTAILSSAVAEVLEKQAFRAIPGNTIRTAATIAGTAAGLFVPGLGLATQLTTGVNASIAERNRQEQAARTGLSFLQDAGFDLAAAPLAWWTLANPSKPLVKVQMPNRTQYLYQILGTVYRPAPPNLIDAAHQ